MIRRSTIVYIVILLALAGLYYFLNHRETPPADVSTSATPEPTEAISYLFSAEQGVPTDILVSSKTEGIVEVARDAQNQWVVKEPIAKEADQAAAEAAATQVTTMRILDRVPEC